MDLRRLAIRHPEDVPLARSQRLRYLRLSRHLRIELNHTHPATIGWETFALVQDLRKHRRRPTKSGIVSPFSGLLYCADCVEKLYYSVTGSYNREQAYFFCSSYRKNSEVCSAHYIRERVVEQITELKALIPELIHEFVDRIVVYAPPQKTNFILFAPLRRRELCETF